jgi:hypothetical protein
MKKADRIAKREENKRKVRDEKEAGAAGDEPAKPIEFPKGPSGATCTAAVRRRAHAPRQA